MFDDFDETTTEEISPEGQETESAVETEDELEEELESSEEAIEEETEEGDPSVEDEAEQGELLLGKFKSVDDLTKAYQNLEKSFHQSRQSQKQPAAQTTADEDPATIVRQAMEQDPIGTIQYFVQQAMAPVQEQRETESLTRNMETVSKQYAKQLGTDEGVKAYFEKISEIATELGNPALVRNPSQRVLRMAAEELWGTETRQQVYDKAKAAGRQEAAETRQAKQGLGAPKGAKPKDQPKTEADTIREGILNASKGGGMFG